MAHKPSDGKYSGRVLFFDIGAPKTLYVYSPAIMFRVTSCDRLACENDQAIRRGSDTAPADLL